MDIQSAIAESFAGAKMRVDASSDSLGLVLHLAGSLDLECSAALQRLMLLIIERDPVTVCLTIDLEQVNYISSTGVGALTIALTTALKSNKRFRLRNLQPKVRSVFSLLGLLSYFEEERRDD